MIDIDSILENFRSGVARCAEHESLVLAAVNRVGESKVADLGFGVGIEQDIGWLDVPMNDATTVGVGEATGDGGNQIESNGRINGFVVGGVVERLPLDELHNDIKHPLDIAEVVN